MGLVTNRVCGLLLAAVLTSSLAAEQPRTGAEDSRWSKRISDRRTSSVGSDWIPLSAPCPSCQPNDRISAAATDEVASLLTPPLPDFLPSFLPPKQFREQQRPTAQQLVRQPNGNQQFIPPGQQQFPPKFALLPESLPNNPPKPELKKPFVQTPAPQFVQTPPPQFVQTPTPQFVQTPTPQFVQQPSGEVPLAVLQQNTRLVTDGPNQFIPPHPQQEFVLQQHGFPQLIAQDSHVQFVTDPNQIRNNQYQQLIGQFFQPPQLNLAQQSTNESDASSSSEEKPEVQLVYVPVETLNQRGRLNIPYKTTSNTLTELKGDLQLQQEPTALAAQESRQQRQSFPHYFEQQQPTIQPQTQTYRPQPTFSPHLGPSTVQPRQKQVVESNVQGSRQVFQEQEPQPTGIPAQIQAQHGQQSLGQQLLQSLRAHPTGVPQQLQQRQQQLAGPHSTRVPQPQLQNQQQPLVNQDHFLQYLRPLPTIASQLLQQQQLQEQQPSPSPRPNSTPIPQLQRQQSSLQDQFLQTQQPTRTPQAQQHVTEQPQSSQPQFLQTQRPRVPQQHRLGVTPPSTQQTPLETQRPLQTTQVPHKIEQTTTAKPVPHQPPLSVYMGKAGHVVKIADVIKVLKNAKTIAVLDSIGPESPQVFVGPSNLKPPLSYAKFELPYLSSIESNRVERKVDQLPFFVAPLNFNPPPGYSKIPFPAPHIGSVVVSNPVERKPTNGQDEEDEATVNPVRGRFTTQYSLPADLPAINPQLPTLVNSLQDSRQHANTFQAPAREQVNAPTRRPFHRDPVEYFQQLPHQQPIQQFRQEVHQVSEAPQTSHFPQTHHTPQFNQFSNFQHVSTTPRAQHFPVNHQLNQQQHEQFSQAPPTPQFAQDLPTSPAPQPSQFPQLNHFPTHTRLVSPNPQHLQRQQTQAPEIPQFQQLSEFTQEQQAPKSQQFQENARVPQSPEIQQYQREEEPPKSQAQPVETEAPQQELPTTPAPRIPKRRPSYRARQRTTEATTSEETSTTTRRPYTRVRRPLTTRHRVQQQETESQHDKPSTTTPQNQFQADEEPSTTEYFTGFKYSTRAPTRSQVDRAQNTRTLAQEDAPKRNSVPRTRTRTRERNSHRVTGQNVPSYQTQVVENRRPNLNAQDEQDTIVPPHESRRQHQVFNENYNTERSGFEEPTTENNQFEQVNSNFPQQNIQNDEITYRQQAGLQVQNALSVSPTRPPLTEYQTSETYFPASPTSQPNSVPFQEVYYPVSSTTAHPELNSFVPQHQPLQSADHHRTRGHHQLVNEQPLNLPQFTLPVQVSVSGQTEKPDVEETPRPVYVRIKGQTRGRRPQNQGGAKVERPVPQYQQQQETSESLRKTVPQEQRLVYQNQLRRPNNDEVPQAQLQVHPQRVSQDVLSKSEDSEEEYGFIRPVSFPLSTVSHEESSIRSQEPNTFEETQSQESPESVEDLGQKTPVNRVRQNFLGRQNRHPVAATEETTTPATTVYTVRPSRRQQSVKQQVRITSIRGRMRRPTTSTTESSDPNISEDRPTSTESHFIRRRPANRFTPSANSNEVSAESQEPSVTPRSSLIRYESPIRGTGAIRRPVASHEEQGLVEVSSTPSAFQITLLDEAPNYPPAYNEQLRGQHNFNYQQGSRPQDLTSLNSENLPRYHNEDPEGGAESQWATKRLPFIYSAQDASTISLITFTTELPNVDQIVTEIPSVAIKENTASESSNFGNVEASNKTLTANQEAEQPATTEYPTDVTSQTFHTEEEDKTFSKDQKELFSAQKKAGDYNLEKKTGAGRRGTWVRVRKVQRPQDSLETAESQNIGALSKNQLQAMASKGILMNSWPLPPPSVVFDDTIFDVPKISPAETYITVDKSADDVPVKSTFVRDDTFDNEQTFGKSEKSLSESVTTTTENSVVTEQYKNEEATTVYIISKSADDTTTGTSNKVVQETVHITTEGPIIETSTETHVVETKPAEVNKTQAIPINNKNTEVNKLVSTDDKIKDETKVETAVTVEESKEEKNGSNDKIVEVTTIQTSNESIKFAEATPKTEVEHQTTESNVDQVKDNSNEETFEKTNSESKDRAHEEHLLIQSSVRDAIEQNTPTEGNTEKQGILQAIEDLFNEPVTTTSPVVDADTPDEIVRTSMRTEVSHETEICFRGRCVKTKSTDNEHLLE